METLGWRHEGRDMMTMTLQTAGFLVIFRNQGIQQPPLHFALIPFCSTVFTENNLAANSRPQPFPAPLARHLPYVDHSPVRHQTR